MKAILSLAAASHALMVMVLLLVCVGLSGCPSRQSVTELEDARQSMLALMQSLRDTAVKLDAEGVIALMDSSSEFFVYEDGKAFNYDEFVREERAGFLAFKSHELSWDSLHVSVVSPDVCVALASFHQALIDTSGVEIRLRGEGTYVAVRRGTKWRFLYLHAWHQLDTASE